MTHLRAYTPDDREFILSLAPRLTIGTPAYRDRQKCISATEGWISGSIKEIGENAAIFIAENDGGERLGFATVKGFTHFTGEEQAYLGELATSELAAGAGVGKLLIEACEQWARDHSYRIMTVDAAADNTQALGFYHHLGYADEDIRLTKAL